MARNLIKSVEDLIRSGKGDTPRLYLILTQLENGEPVFSDDRKYLDTLLSGK